MPKKMHVSKIRIAFDLEFGSKWKMTDREKASLARHFSRLAKKLGLDPFCGTPDHPVYMRVKERRPEITR